MPPLMDFPFSSEPVALPSYIGRNPVSGLDYLRQERALVPETYATSYAGKAELVLRYVPDRYILEPGIFHTIVQEIAAKTSETTSHDPDIQLTWQVMHRLNDDLIPRWIQVLLRLPLAASSSEETRQKEETHMNIAVLFEDRQPTWKNPALLANLTWF